MQLPQIRIQQQSAEIGIRYQPQQIEVEQEEAQLHIDQRPAELRMTTKPGRLTIDQSKALADLHMIPSEQFIRKTANEAMQTAIAGTKKKQREGDRLMKIENGGNPIADIAKQNGQWPKKQIALGWLPSGGGVTFDYQPAELEIEAIVQPVAFRVQSAVRNIHYQRGGVETYLQQKNWIQIDFDQLKFRGFQYELDI
ncbi:DUF6470 family protein [Gracilibacillus alcaliphilus]|uniref:DUF6470 family protein n=1 Tax=Gracilibacillus alcaliphilus TaxID=1401441 RepID=UPI001956C21B|nr:hypothetical protein [Gracilibacillus alcaliphilus]